MQDDLIARIEAAGKAGGLLDVDITQVVFGRKVGVRKYTSSLDAAITLVPDDLYPTLDFVAGRCWLRDVNGHDVRGVLAYGCGATMPLAICAASLRARAAIRATPPKPDRLNGEGKA